jgi:phenylacetate-CoA ligase
MQMGRLDSLYARMPASLQHVAISAYGAYWHWLRFGPGFSRYLGDFQRRDRFNRAQWASWIDVHVRRLLQHAASQVPYYQHTWDERTKAAARAGRVEELPLLDKEPVRADPDAFCRRDVRPLRRLTFHTSGSTGTPVASIWTAREVRRSMALREARSARWAGVSFAKPRATFSGRLVEPNPDSRGPYHRFNAVERQVYLSAFHLSARTAPRYAEAMTRHRVHWLTGYAFSCYTLAKHILELAIEPPSLEAVITTSEPVTRAMRKTMEDAFGCPVYEEYGTVEDAAFASQCPSGRLHVNPDAGIVEILRPDGTRCAGGEEGELVATSLVRDYQLFVRYRVGDLARWDDEPCPCGRTMPVLAEVVGRLEDAVVGPDGRRLVRFHGLFVDQPHVVEAQVIQEALTRIRVKVVPAAGFGAPDVADIVSRTQTRLGRQIEIVVEPVDRIPRTRAGKFRAVISLLNHAESDDRVRLRHHSLS